MTVQLPDRYSGYLYAYPHKSAYRALDPVTLAEAWADEDHRSLFLYLHVPFCEMRCGFCNLFTQANPEDGRTEAWLAAVRRQVQATAEALPDASFSRLAVGGGTPTMLEPRQLEVLFALAGTLGVDPRRVPTSVEVSPRTADAERLRVLADHGVDRISIGVESFDPVDLRALGRPQRPGTVEQALAAIREIDVPILNVDLIYGTPGQTVPAWLATLERALAWAPEELYLYPLYARPLTGLAGTSPSDDRAALYEAGRERLLAAGYHQRSMRSFRRGGVGEPADQVGSVGAERGRGSPSYDCQDDGMVGIGVGARSYTRALHYSHDYAVSRTAVSEIVGRYLAATVDEHRSIRHGLVLDDHEQRRRFVIKSVLCTDGLDLERYRSRFGSDAIDDLPILSFLVDRGYLHRIGAQIVPTPLGLAFSDAIGPAFVSPAVTARMKAFTLT